GRPRHFGADDRSDQLDAGRLRGGSPMSASHIYLPAGLPAPLPSPDGLDAPYWEASLRHELVCQRCRACGEFQWGPEWICHRCRSFDVGWERVEPRGVVFSWERIWHPVHPALRQACPYIIVLVALDIGASGRASAPCAAAGGVRMVGNLLGDPRADVHIG